MYSEGSSDEEEDQYDDFKIHEMMVLGAGKPTNNQREDSGRGSIDLISLDHQPNPKEECTDSQN